MRLSRFIRVVRMTEGRVEQVTLGVNAKRVPVFIDPSPDQYTNLSRTSSGLVRGIITPDDHVAAWNGYDATHHDIAKNLALDGYPIYIQRGTPVPAYEVPFRGESKWNEYNLLEHPVLARLQRGYKFPANYRSDD